MSRPMSVPRNFQEVARRIAAGAVTVGITVLAACSSDSTAPPQPTETALNITNSAPFTVARLFVRPCGSLAYDVTGSGDLSPSATIRIPVAAGCYDVAALSDNASGGKHALFGAQTVTEGQVTRVILGAVAFHTPASDKHPCQLPPGSSTSVFFTEWGMLASDFGEPTMDDPFALEMLAQTLFWNVPAKVLAWYGDGPLGQAKAFRDGNYLGYIAFGYNFYRIHHQLHGNVGIAGTLAHEWGHVIQDEYKWPTSRHSSAFLYPAYVIWAELQADAFAGYYMWLSKAQSSDEIAAFYDHMGSIGDTLFWHPEHHGTSAQRKAAAYIGLRTAYYQKQNSRTYTYNELYQIFINAISSEIINRSTGAATSASLLSAAGERSPAVVAALEQLPRGATRDIAQGRTTRGPFIPAVRLSRDAVARLAPRVN